MISKMPPTLLIIEAAVMSAKAGYEKLPSRDRYVTFTLANLVIFNHCLIYFRFTCIYFIKRTTEEHCS